MDFDIVPKVLTLTAGTRWYHYTEYELGSKYTTGLECENIAGPCYGGATSIDAENEHKGYKGFKSRVNLTWHITQDMMAYYTYSEGFRPGGFNRTVAHKADDSEGNPQYNSPLGYSSRPASPTGDRIQERTSRPSSDGQSGLVDCMEWDNVQSHAVRPRRLGQHDLLWWNGSSYQIDGAELQIAVQPMRGLTVQAQQHVEQPESDQCAWSRGKTTPAACRAIRMACSFGNASRRSKAKPYTNPFGLLGDAAGVLPGREFNLRARYDFNRRQRLQALCGQVGGEPRRRHGEISLAELCVGGSCRRKSF